MNPIRIKIPNQPVQQQAGAIVIDTIREAGMDPTNQKVQSHPMIRGILGMWGRGEWTRRQALHALRNLTILNPSLRA